jgi:glucan phosphoethanolaminetransferase (alkaline phosphatase superfamily)
MPSFGWGLACCALVALSLFWVLACRDQNWVQAQWRAVALASFTVSLPLTIVPVLIVRAEAASPVPKSEIGYNYARAVVYGAQPERQRDFSPAFPRWLVVGGLLARSKV